MLAAAILLSGACPVTKDHDGKYLVPGKGGEGRMQLKQPVTLVERQDGIDDSDVTRWMIEPSGEFKVYRYRTKAENPDPAEGRLVFQGRISEDDLMRLGRLLEENRLAELPPAIGTDRQSNNHQYTLMFGDKKIRLGGAKTRRNIRGQRQKQSILENIKSSIPPNETESTDGGPKVEEWIRFANIANSIEKHCLQDR